jgi:tripartite-type tricarboxylate transporter receptor subunit TctC
VNRVGASGVIGAMAVRSAPADGYTLLVARIATHAVVPALDSKAPYKWNEFTMLSLIELNPYVCFVKSDSPYKTAADLIADIRANPGKLNFSTAGVGTSQNMAVQYWLSLAGLGKDHAVGIHYKGGGEVTTAVLGGQVQFACNNVPTVISHIKAGTLRGLMVTPARLSELPEVPSAREAGFPDMEKIVGWTALMGPPGLPKEVVDRWTDTFARLAKDPDWISGNAKLGGIAAIRSPAETEKFVREQYELYDRLVTTLGIRQ